MRLRVASLAGVFLLAFLGSSTGYAEPSLDELKTGFESIQEWDIDQARTVAERLYQKDPNHPLVLALVAQVKLQMSDYAGSTYFFEKAEAAGAPPIVLVDAPLAQAAHVATKNYIETKSENFIIRHEPGKDAVLVPYAIETLEATMATVGALLNYRPQSRIVVEFYPNAATLAAVSTLTEEEIANSGTIALCKWNRLMVTTPRAIVFGYQWRDTLSHELVHLLISGASKNTVPIWLHEGIAKYAETAWRAQPGLALSVEAQRRLKTAAKKGTLIPFAKMHPSMAKLKTQEESSLAFSEVFTFIEFLVEQKDWVGIRSLLTTLSTGKTMETSIEEVYGQAFTKLTAAWKKQLPKREIRRDGRAIGKERKLVIKKRSNTPDDKLHGLSKRARRFARAADLLYARGRLVAAQRELEKAYRTTKSPLLSAKLANVALAAGDLKGAEHAARKAIEGVPDLPGPNLTLAEVLVRQDRGLEARESIETAININPFDPRIHSLKLAILGPQGDEDELRKAQEALFVLNQSERLRAPDFGVGGLVQIEAMPFARIFIIREGDYGKRVLATGMMTPSAPLVLRPGPIQIQLLPARGEAVTYDVQITKISANKDPQIINLNNQGS